MSRFGKRGTRKVEDVKDYDGGSSLAGSGLFTDVTLVAAFLNKNEKTKSESIGFVLEKDGKQHVDYSAIKLINNDGKHNDIGIDSLHYLCITLGIEDGIDGLEVDTDDTMELPTGAGKKLEEREVWSQLSGVEISYIRIVNFFEWNDRIMQGVSYKTFYRNSDKATAGEIARSMSGDESVVFGTKFNKDLEYYSKEGTDHNKYGVFTKEGIAEWAKAGYSKDYPASKAKEGNSSSTKKAGRTKFARR